MHSASRPVLRDRRLDGRHAGAAVGGDYPEQLFSRRAASPARAAPLGAEHRLPRGRPPGDHGRSRLAGRRLSPARHGAGEGPRGRAHGRAHHLSLARRPCSASSAATCSATAWAAASTPTSRWRATCATRARPSSTASTPTPTSTSPAPWTISTWRRATAACWPRPSAARADALLRALLHLRLAVPDRREPRHRPCAERRRPPRQLRRDRDRQGPRRLPARRAGDVPHAARLPRAARPRCGACA